MALIHMVWIKFRDTVPASRIEAHLAAAQSLAGSVPGIRELSTGRNVTHRANGFTHGLTVILDDEAALAAYAVHPRHVVVASALREDAELMAMDYLY